MGVDEGNLLVMGVERHIVRKTLQDDHTYYEKLSSDGEFVVFPNILLLQPSFLIIHRMVDADPTQPNTEISYLTVRLLKETYVHAYTKLSKSLLS